MNKLILSKKEEEIYDCGEKKEEEIYDCGEFNGRKKMLEDVIGIIEAEENDWKKVGLTPDVLKDLKEKLKELKP